MIINVLLALDRVGFPGHTSAAAATYQQAGEQINRFVIGSRSGVQMGNLLNQIKIPLLDDRFMGVLNADPFFSRFMDNVFQLVIVSFLPSLQQNAGVGFLLQDTDYSTGGPLGIRHIREAAGRVGQATAVLVGHGQYAWRWPRQCGDGKCPAQHGRHLHQ